MIKKNKIVISLFFIFLCFFFFYEIDVKYNEHESSKEQWVSVDFQHIENQLGLSGYVQSAHQITLTAPFSGVIEKVLFNEGQEVKKGQVLLMINSSLVDMQLRQLYADYLKVKNEVSIYQDWDNSPEMSRSRRAVKIAQDTLQNLNHNLNDTKNLFKRGIVSRMEVETLYQQTLSQKQTLIDAQEEYYRMKQKGKSNESRIIELNMINAKNRYDELKVKSEKKILRAPFSGYITKSLSSENNKLNTIQEGVLINGGDPLLTISSIDKIHINAKIEEIDVNEINKNMPVKITGDAFKNKNLIGHISEIGMQTNDNNSQGVYYNVIVSVDSPSEGLPKEIRLGMSAKLSITTYLDEHGIIVPAEAIHTDKTTLEKYIIYRSSINEKPKKVKIDIGPSVVQGVVVYGVSPGELLLSSMEIIN